MTYLQWGGRIRCAPALLSKFILAQGARRERTRMGHSGRTEELAGSGGGGFSPRGPLLISRLGVGTTALPPPGGVAVGVGGRAEGARRGGARHEKRNPV